LGALDALRDANIRVPDDVALLGFDSMSQSSYTSPLLTRVDVYKREIRTIAIDILHQQIIGSSGSLAVKILTPTRLIARISA